MTSRLDRMINRDRDFGEMFFFCTFAVSYTGCYIVPLENPTNRCCAIPEFTRAARCRQADVPIYFLKRVRNCLWQGNTRPLFPSDSYANSCLTAFLQFSHLNKSRSTFQVHCLRLSAIDHCCTSDSLRLAYHFLLPLLIQ